MTNVIWKMEGDYASKLFRRRLFQNAKGRRDQFARHETRNGVEARRDRSPNPSSARRAASVQRSYFAQKLFDLRAVGVNAGDAQPHVALIVYRQRGQRVPTVIAEHAQRADQIKA